MAFQAPLRINLIHPHVPTFVWLITTIFTNLSLIIENTNKQSREKIAYTVIDMATVSAEQQAELTKELLHIPEVIRVRFLKNPRA